jgi:hypothetical protein
LRLLAFHACAKLRRFGVRPIERAIGLPKDRGRKSASKDAAPERDAIDGLRIVQYADCAREKGPPARFANDQT